MRVTLTVALSAVGALASGELEKRLNNGLGKTPAMGWNSWNAGGCNAATASMAIKQANLFISLGLKDLGYQYVNIDDCWSTMARSSNGSLVPDPNKWPNGIKAVTDQIHGLGLKFGLYGCAGTKTCAGYPGSQGYETKDAQTLAAWGVDYWKHDNCYTPCNGGLPQTCGSPAGNTTTWYAKMRDALVSVQSQKPIFFSLCQWGRDNVWQWGAQYGNAWRMSVDVWNDWASVVRVGSAAAGIYQYSAPYGFNDLDMLQIGNGVLNEAESRTQFGIWAISKSPLIIGTDLSKVSSNLLNIMKNKILIDINQDSLGKAATYFRPSGSAAPVSGQLYPYWAGPLSNGVVVALTNANSGAQTLSFNFKDVPGLGTGTYSWTEAYSGQTGSGTSISASVGAHDTKVYRFITGVTTSTPTQTSSTSTSTTNPTCAALYGQCGGDGFTGPTCCSQGTCKYSNQWYSQCLN